MNDLISRQAAIDALGEEPELWRRHAERGDKMTTQEAIKYLEVLTVIDAPKLEEAIDMAIKALEQQEKEVKS